ncbi:MAG: ribosome maturation factor RimP [Desulfobacterales bacterium]|nr:ribosome maturation factor RimP [Desulfobacterales bacterium]
MKKAKKKHSPAGPEAGEKPSVAPQEVVSLVWELGDPLCAAEGMELVHVEYQREPGGWVLRLFIEKPDGVGVEDCSTVSRQLGDLLDIKLETDLPYTLEVSSPGPERPLSKKTDFNRFAGHTARIRTRKPLGGQKNFKGVLAGITEDDMIRLTLEQETVAIPYREMTRARLVNYHGDDKC